MTRTSEISTRHSVVYSLERQGCIILTSYITARCHVYRDNCVSLKVLPLAALKEKKGRKEAEP